MTVGIVSRLFSHTLVPLLIEAIDDGEIILVLDDERAVVFATIVAVLLETIGGGAAS